MPLLAEVVSCHEGSVFVPSYISRGTPRAAKGAAASTSSQPQAVMDSSADTSAPLASRLAGGESLGGSCRNRLLKGACPQTKTTQTERQPTRTEAHQERVPPQATSGSEADSMSRGWYPVTGTPHRSRLPLDTYLPTKPSFIRHRLSTKSSSPERHPTRTKAHRERGTPTGDFWKRSGQHEPRRVPGHGAPPIEAVFRQALPFLFSRWTCPT